MAVVWVLICILSFLIPPSSQFSIRGSIAESQRRTNHYIRGCYYTNWSQYRPGAWRFLPENYEPGLCTHLFYAFVVMHENFTLKPFEWNDEDTQRGVGGMYRRLNALKSKQPDLKTLLSFGGYKFSQERADLIRRMATNAQNRRVFIDSSIQYLRQYEFDGFDFDWEYPEWDTKGAYAVLIQELRQAMETEARISGRPRLLLTAAVAASPDRIVAGYDGRILDGYFDFLNVMTYDFHGAWESETGFSSPLYDRQGDRLALSSAMSFWHLNQSVPKEKLVAGLAAYGRGWTLPYSSSSAASSGLTSTGATAVGPSPAQSATQTPGVLAYFEICQLIESGQYGVQFDAAQRVPYMYKDNLWIGYDDTGSINEKLDWIVQNGYGGAFVWSLDFDDFNGRCASSSGVKYPLISAVKAKLGGGAHSPYRPPSNTAMPGFFRITGTFPPISTSPPPTEFQIDAFQCSSGHGYFPDPVSCNHFYQCDEWGGAFHKECPPGLHFNKAIQVCDWPGSAKCGHGQ